MAAIARVAAVLTAVGALALSTAAASDAAPPSGCHQLDGTVTCTFAYTGSEQQLPIPADLASVHLELTGAAGGAGETGSASAPGGAGGTAAGDVAVHAGEILYVEVGGRGGTGASEAGGAGGWNGGAAGGIGRGGGGGGGASDIRTVSCGATCPGDANSLASRLIVAGGGGGGAGNTFAGSGGGGATGSAGADGFLSTSPTGGAQGGGGATPSSGGAGGGASFCGNAGDVNGEAGTSGVLGSGGAGGSGAPQFGGGVNTGTGTARGGGGGGGTHGGGGGGSTGTVAQCGAGGGGGGSTSIPGTVTGGSTGVASVSVPAGVTITYAAPASSSKTYYVASGGSGADCSTNSAAHPFATIQDALACAGDGDVVSVAPAAAPYPGIGTVRANVTIRAAPGSSARGVTVDVSQPDDATGTLTVPAGSSVEVDGLTLECASHTCTNSNVVNNGTLVLRGDTITGAGKAAAVLNRSAGSPAATLSVFSSTIAHNTNDNGVHDLTVGGGIDAEGAAVTVVNSTIADNTTVGGDGGGIFVVGGVVTLVNSTISANHATVSTLGGGGIYVPAGSDPHSVLASNTLIAGNDAPAGGGPDCQGTIADGPGGHNLIADSNGCSGVSDGQNGDILDVAGPAVTAVGDHGGPTDTVALEDNSLAIGSGDRATCESAPVGGADQRDASRNATSRAACDIGSFDTGGSGGQPFRTWFVAPGGAAATCQENSSTRPFARIQDALACAGDGDVVSLAPSGATPYPGVGPVLHNVTIEPTPGADAASVRVDVSRPDNTTGALSVPDTASVAVRGLTLDCVSHGCAHSNVLNEGTLTLQGDEVTGAGRSVAVMNDTVGSAHARLTVLDSAIVHNTDAEDLDGQGGGLASGGGGPAAVTVANTTIADNASTGSGQGGGVAAFGATRMTLTNVTIIRNRATGTFGGGGIYVPAGSDPGTIRLTNTLLAANTSDHAGTDCQGTLADGGHNLVGDASGCSGLADGNGNQLGVADPGLGSLAYNGGATETAALLSGSSASAGGDPGTCEGALVGDRDQRGVARHTGARAACSIGSYDGGGASNTAPTIDVSSPVAGGHYVQGSVVTVIYSCSDPDGSGDLKSCQGRQGSSEVASGGSLDTATAGSHTLTVDAADWAGHSATKAVTYTVDATSPGPTPPGHTSSGGGTPPGKPGGSGGGARSADLTVSGRLSGRHVRAGATIAYTVTVRNRGPAKATGVVVSATMPGTLELRSLPRMHGGRCTQQGRRILCAFSGLRAGRELRFTIAIRALKAGPAIIRLLVTAHEHDPIPRNNRQTTTTAIAH